MTPTSERDQLLELMARYADMADTKDWDDLPRSVLCDEITFAAPSLGSPSTTTTREAWCAASRAAFAGWAATHHAVTGHRIAVDGDRATIRAHVRAEHWAPSEVVAGGPDCWLVVGFYENVAARTTDGWRLSSITLTATHQENPDLLAAVMAAARGQ